MEIERAHRVKTFGLAVALLLSAVAAGGTWLDESVPLDHAGVSTEPVSQTADESSFAQSGGLVPDAGGEAVYGEPDVRQAAAGHAQLATVR